MDFHNVVTGPAAGLPRQVTVVRGAVVWAQGVHWQVAPRHQGNVVLVCRESCGLAVLRERGQHYVLPLEDVRAGVPLDSGAVVWLLPEPPAADAHALLVEAVGPVTVRPVQRGWEVTVAQAPAMLTAFEQRPHADALGCRLTLAIPEGDRLADAMAAFYWDHLLRAVAERTNRASPDDREGYVLSTLSDTYRGTYPAVDHEFQVKGRLALGGAFDLDLVRRIIDLNLRLVREDPALLGRVPCAVQPNGDREYHVQRRSGDGAVGATMFLLTGNVEVLEAAWLYVALTKDRSWLGTRLAALEEAAEWVAEHVDHRGRVWSDVYYEDQVMKDGRECMAAALAARSFELLAGLEEWVGRSDAAARYGSLGQAIRHALVAPLPLGYWSPAAGRFVDWVDRYGVAHDHGHLLANELPVLFGYASPEQARAVSIWIDEQVDAFQRFPTFVASRVEDYGPSEIGVGGPYDLCAAGRYWCWDAAFWASRGRGDRILRQLLQVAQEAASGGYHMGERYDMDHVYYVDGRNWHGAGDYYEYPAVFLWTLLHEYLGIGYDLTVDLRVAPRVVGTGGVRLDTPWIAVEYTLASEPPVFTLRNLLARTRRFAVDLSGVYPGIPQWAATVDDDNSTVVTGEPSVAVTVPGGALVTLRPLASAP